MNAFIDFDYLPEIFMHIKKRMTRSNKLKHYLKLLERNRRNIPIAYPAPLQLYGAGIIAYAAVCIENAVVHIRKKS